MQFVMKNLLVLALVLGTLVALGTSTILHHHHARKAGCQGGQKDLCASVRCGYYSKCQVVKGRATCVCDEQNCTANYQPVCGSDGKTYSNECKLRAEACKRQKDIQVASQGECGCKSKGKKGHKHHHHHNHD